MNIIGDFVCEAISKGVMPVDQPPTSRGIKSRVRVDGDFVVEVIVVETNDHSNPPDPAD